MCTMQYFGEFVLIIPLLKSKCKFFVFIKWQSITPDASSPFHSVNLNRFYLLLILNGLCSESKYGV